MLDSGAGGADIMMNFGSGTEMGLLDPAGPSGLAATVRVGLFMDPIYALGACHFVLSNDSHNYSC